MLEVLHVLGSGRPESTGMARIVTALAQGLPRERYQLHAWFLEEGGPLQGELAAAGVQTRVVRWRRGKRDPLGALRFCRNLRQRRFAIVHQHAGGRSIRWAVRAASSARTVVHVHGRVDESSGWMPVPTTIRGADATIAVSEAVARYVSGGAVDVVYPGAPAGASIPATRSGKFVMGTACRLESIKGLEILLQAVALLGGAYRLEIAGSGSQRSELERLSLRLGIEARVRFLGWRYDLREVMPGWHAFVQASLDEGFGIAALEAMAAGLPVVATRAGGQVELVRHGETGLLVAPRQPRELAGAIEALEGAENLRLDMAWAARRRAATNFSARQMCERIEGIYSRVLASSSAGA